MLSTQSKKCDRDYWRW